MKCTKDEMFFFAVRRETGQAVNISEMEEKDRGKNCNCICAACGRPLVAKLGRRSVEDGGRRPHFSHLPDKNSEINCSAAIANESGLHKMAKQIIHAGNSIVLPKIEIDGTEDPNHNEDDYKQCSVLIFMPERIFPYRESYLEVNMGNFVPDICLSNGKNELLVEIAVTHFVDEAKYKKIRSANKPTIEIDISDFLHDKNFSREKLAEELFQSTAHKKWIHHRLQEKMMSKLSSRNHDLEVEYQSKREKEQLKEKKRNDFIEKQKAHEQGVETEYKRLVSDEKYYLQIDRALIQPESALKQINAWHICNLTLNQIEELPFFFNIPVFGEVAFTCDRRIWQSVLFEHYFFRKEAKETITPAKIYVYFAGQHFIKGKNDYINEKYVHLRKTRTRSIYFPRNEHDILRSAIEEYLVHLSALGFIEKRYYDYPDPQEEYQIERFSLVPPSNQYAHFLKNALIQIPPTSDPFHYLQENWIKFID